MDKAIVEDFQGLIKHHSFELVDKLKNRNVVTCKTILKNNSKLDRTHEKRKERTRNEVNMRRKISKQK